MVACTDIDDLVDCFFDTPDPDCYQIRVPLLLTEMSEEAWAAQKEIPNKFYAEETYDVMDVVARNLSRKYPTIPIAIESIWGSEEHDTNSFNAEEYREEERYLAGVSVEVPDDEKKRI